MPDEISTNSTFNTLDLQAVGDNHEPPIGLGGGSFFCDVPASFQLNDTETVSDGFRLYTFSSDNTFIAIRSIAVLTELPDNHGAIRFDRFIFEETLTPLLRMWLGTGANEISENDPPHVIVNGADGGRVFLNANFSPFNSPLTLNKEFRTARFRHPDSQMRVIKWEVVNRAGSEPLTSSDLPVILADGVRCSDTGADMYYFYVAFDHEEHEHE